MEKAGIGGMVGNQISSNHNYESYEDLADVEYQRLRQEAYEAAQIAAISQPKAEALTGGNSVHATHTVMMRSSEKEFIKAAQKAQKRANQAFQRVKAAGAVIDKNDLQYGVGGSNELTQGHGGLMN